MLCYVALLPSLSSVGPALIPSSISPVERRNWKYSVPFSSKSTLHPHKSSCSKSQSTGPVGGEVGGEVGGVVGEAVGESASLTL